MQRFQGLDRHRPCGALPAGGWSASFLPLFVGMTPLATDGPGSGSGAGFGRDHAEKWRSGGVSRTTVMVTKTTDSVDLNPADTRTAPPSPHQIPSGTNPRRRARAPRRRPPPVPYRTRTKQKTGHVVGLHYSADRIGSSGLSGAGQAAGKDILHTHDPKTASRTLPRAALSPLAPTNKIVAHDPHPHQHNQETPCSPQLDRVPFTPYVIVSLLREPATDTRSHGEQVPFSAQTSTVLTSGGRGHVDGGAQLCP